MAFTLTSNDWITFHIDHLNRSRNFQRSMFLRRYVVPAMMLAGFFSIYGSSLSLHSFYKGAHFWILALLIALFYKKTYYWRLRRSLQKKNTPILGYAQTGDYQLELAKDRLMVSNPNMKNEFLLSSLFDIVEHRDRIYLYTSPANAVIVPQDAFADNIQRQKFLENLHRAGEEREPPARDFID